MSEQYSFGKSYARGFAGLESKGFTKTPSQEKDHRSGYLLGAITKFVGGFALVLHDGTLGMEGSDIAGYILLGDSLVQQYSHAAYKTEHKGLVGIVQGLMEKN